MTYPAASESKNREQDGEVIKSMTVGTSTRAPNYIKKKRKLTELSSIISSEYIHLCKLFRIQSFEINNHDQIEDVYKQS